MMAQVNGNSALAGASGAVMGEYIAQKMYPGINREDLTEEQRQTISALGTLASGLAGGLAGGSTADAVAGAQAGKNALENNFLLQILVPPPPVAGQAPQSEANTIIAQKLDAAVKEFGRDVVKQCLSGGDCPMPVQIALLAIQAMMGQDESSSNPNVGKNLTDEQKAELGGTGSRTPGGWGPEDEENARNNDLVIDEKKYDYLFGNSASNPHNAARSNQLASTMENLGIYNDAGGQRILAEHFKATANTPRNVINTFSNEFGTFEVRESLLMGPSGKAARLQTTFEILPNGSRKFVTTIPK